LGGFLLSLKTFILIQLKKEVFESPLYREHYLAVQGIQETAGLYEPLKSLGYFLLYSVLFSLLTSACQITVGFIANKWAAIFCFGLGLTTLSLVFRAWWAIRLTLRAWFDQLK